MYPNKDTIHLFATIILMFRSVNLVWPQHVSILSHNLVAIEMIHVPSQWPYSLTFSALHTLPLFSFFFWGKWLFKNVGNSRHKSLAYFMLLRNYEVKFIRVKLHVRGVNKKFVHFINNVFIWRPITLFFIQPIHCTNFNIQFKY